MDKILSASIRLGASIMLLGMWSMTGNGIFAVLALLNGALFVFWAGQAFSDEGGAT